MISAPEITPADLPRDLTFSSTMVRSSAVAVGEITKDFIPQEDFRDTSFNQSSASTMSWEQQLGQLAKKMLEDGRENVFQELLNRFEKSVIEAALETTRGRKVEAAERLGIGRNTITRKLNDLGIKI
jgi:two-component system nitrogen regulation response regulator GlnG